MHMHTHTHTHTHTHEQTHLQPRNVHTLAQLSSSSEQEAKSDMSDAARAAQVFPNVYEHLGSELKGSPLIGKVTRLLDIWKERGIYDESFLGKLRSAVSGGGGGAGDYSPSDAPVSSHRSSGRPSGSSSGGGGGSVNGNMPKMSGAAMELAEMLSRKEGLFKQCESLSEQLKHLRQDVFAAQPGGGVSATETEIKEANLVLDLQGGALKEYQQVMTGVMQKMKGMLSEYVGEYQRLNEAVKANAASKAAVGNVEVRQAPSLEFQGAANGSRPPAPTASDDEDDGDDYNPGDVSNKRQKIDDPDKTP